MPKELPLVLPVVTPYIHRNDYISAIYQLTKRSPTRTLDASNRSLGDYYTFLASLGEFSEQIDIQQATRFRDNYLNHLSFSFLFHLSKDEYIEILRETELSCLDNLEMPDRELVVIVSGTLKQWKESCLLFCSEDYSFRVRYIFDAVVLYLEKCKALSGLSKRFLNDQSFILE